MSTTIESLELEILSSSQSAESGLDKLTASLEKLKIATKGGLGLTAVVKQTKAVSTATNGISANAANNVTGLAKAIQLFSGVKISSTVAKQITAVSTALAGADFTGSKDKLTSLGDALSTLSVLPKTNLASYVNNLKKLPDVLNALDDAKISAVADKCKKLATALEPLGTQMQKVANGFSAFPTKLQRLLNATNRVPSSFKKATGSTTDFYSALKMATSGVKTLANKIASCITKVNEYVENVNLFTVSMGKYAEKSSEYAATVGEVMGLDPSDWMKNQGIFMTLATGFGVAGDRAEVMSQQLTQLGYDISSFYNIGVEDAMQKLQSGLSGELEPLRRLGYDLSQAKLEATALSLGIDKSVSSMTQAEKAQLRYYAIMTQVTTAQGDMARTLNSPANQLRIFKAQVVQAARAIGSIFIPALNAVLPWAIAFTKVIRILAEEIASLFGFEMPEIDYSGIDSVTGGAEDASDALDDATASAKKLKSNLLGFDELNVINPNEDASSELDNVLGGFDFELPTYDFISDAVDSRVNEIMGKLEPLVTWLKTHLDDIKEVVVAIGAGFIAWKFANGFTSMIEAIQKGGLNKIALGLTLMVTGITLGFQGAYDIGYEGANVENVLKTALGGALGIAGSLLVFGTGPVGWTIGIGVALATTIIGFSVGVDKRLKEEDLAKRFGEYVLSDAEVAELASKLTDVPIKGSISVYLDEIATLNNAKAAVESATQELNSLNFRIKLGLEVSRESYKTAIDNYISSVEGYLVQQQITSALAIDIMFQDSEMGANLSTFVQTYFGEAQTKLQDLGEKLKKCVSEGFVDGVWIEDKFQEAVKIETEIQEVLTKLSDIEFRAKIKAIKADAAGIALTPESLKNTLSKLQEVIDEQVKNLDGIRLNAIAIAEMKYDDDIAKGMSEKAAAELRDTAIAEAQAAFIKGKLELSFGTLEFGTDAIMEAYKDELGDLSDLMASSIEDIYGEAWLKITPDMLVGYGEKNPAKMLASALKSGISSAILEMQIMSPSIQEDYKELLKEFAPSIASLEDAAKQCREAGQAIPKNILQGLNNAKLMEALSGSAEAIDYLIGQKFSTDKSFLDLLSTCENAGKDMSESIREGLRNNLTVVRDESAGTITLINDTIGEQVLKETPTLVKNLEGLGFNISEGLKKGVTDKLEEDKPAYKGVFGKISGWVKELFRINSPSKVFEELGRYISEGLYNGIDSGLGNTSNWVKTHIFDPFKKAMSGGVTFTANVKNDASTWWNNVKTWWNGKVGEVTRFTTNVTNQCSGWWNNVKYWWSTKVGSVASFSTNVLNQASAWWSNAKYWWSTKVSSVESFTTSVKNQSSTWWSNVKTWWNNKSSAGVDMEVNAVKGWSGTIKKALGITDVDLGFKLPKIKVTWGEKTVAGFTIKFPNGFSTYAQGGFPNLGEMFIAREAGPELVGTIGNRSAVVNNDQIVESVSTGVYQAVIAALGSNSDEGGNTQIIVNLDGEKIYENQQKVARNRGYNLGMGAFSFG